MIVLRRIESPDEYAPLTWKPWPLRSGDVIADTVCANGHVSTMVRRIHSVAGDGTVTPSYVCPFEGCGWHEWVRLGGWTPVARTLDPQEGDFDD